MSRPWSVGELNFVYMDVMIDWTLLVFSGLALKIPVIRAVDHRHYNVLA